MTDRSARQTIKQTVNGSIEQSNVQTAYRQKTVQQIKYLSQWNRQKHRPSFWAFPPRRECRKSTLAEIVSSILYYEKGIELFIVDCDLSQDSFYKLRQREKTFVEGDPLGFPADEQLFFNIGTCFLPCS